jgi:hypothetical protein
LFVINRGGPRQPPSFTSRFCGRRPAEEKAERRTTRDEASAAYVFFSPLYLLFTTREVDLDLIGLLFCSPLPSQSPGSKSRVQWTIRRTTLMPKLRSDRISTAMRTNRLPRSRHSVRLPFFLPLTPVPLVPPDSLADMPRCRPSRDLQPPESLSSTPSEQSGNAHHSQQ